MPVFLPDLPHVLAWERVLHALQATGDPDKAFVAAQRKGGNLAGYIIGGWGERGNLGWYFCGTGDPWESFNDDTVAQTPWMYATLRGALKRMEQLRRDWSPKHLGAPVAHIGLVYWIHPEADHIPLDDYVHMTEGGHFPGSPRH